jgi:hypothetical protein
MLRALFSLQDATSRPQTLGDLQLSQEHALAPVAASELMLWAMESRSSFLLMLNFATDLFDATTARRWLGEFDTLLASVLRDPKQAIGTIPLLPADELTVIESAGGQFTTDGAGVVPASLLDKGTEVSAIEILPGLGAPKGATSSGAREERHLLGRPSPGTRWRVLGPQGEIVPIGVGGELVVDLGDGPRRTGERVRLLVDGTLEHLGRGDGRIRIRDRLVDPSEIAKALSSHGAVREAAVMAHDDAAGEPRLVAYYAPREGVSCTETELRSLVRSALGDAQVPRLFVELDALPRDASGAVDTDRLPSPYALSSTQEYVAPRTPAERYIADVWKEALNVGRIGVYDNFFDLGGHSLLCFRVIARIEQEKGKRVSPRVMLLNTLEQVATQLDGATAAPRPTAPTETPTHGADDRGAPAGGGIRGWIKRIVKG